jgi:hypothetical protein
MTIIFSKDYIVVSAFQWLEFEVENEILIYKMIQAFYGNIVK